MLEQTEPNVNEGRQMRMARTLLGGLMIWAWCISASAEADGPDYFRVVDVAQDDVLNIRSEGNANAPILGTIPAGADGVKNLGCTGGLSFVDWQNATQEERDAAAKTRWCRVSFDGTEGWAAGWFLAEGTMPVSDPIAPSFDCAKAGTSAEEEICKDPHLARLDLELARLYRLAVNGPNMTSDRLDNLKATQRGWVKGRDDCWKATIGLSRCIADNYVMRIDEIRTGYADARAEDAEGISIGPLAYACPGLDALVSFVAVNADPSMISLRWREVWLVATEQRTGSGARYEDQTAEGTFGFWIKGNEAQLSRPGEPDLTCEVDDIG